MIQQFDRLLRLWVIGVCAFVFLVACGSLVSPSPPESLSASEENCQTIQHHAGPTKVCGQPQKIAALSPPLLDVLLALGVQPAAYATVDLVTRPQFDRPAEQIPFLGEKTTSQPVNLGSRDAPSQEALLRVKPQLILGEEYQSTYYDRFSNIAPTLLFNTQGADRWKQIIMPIAQVIGRETQAQQVLDAHAQRIANAKSALAPLVAQQKILVLGFDTVIANSFILERQDFICDLLEDMGFQVINARTGNLSLNFSLEVLPRLDTNMILVMPTGSNTIANAKQQWQDNPVLQSVPAAKARKIYFMDYELTRIRGPIAAEIFINQLQALLTNQ